MKPDTAHSMCTGYMQIVEAVKEAARGSKMAKFVGRLFFKDGQGPRLSSLVICSSAI